MTDPFDIDPFADEVEEDITSEAPASGPWDEVTDNTEDTKKEKVVVQSSEGKVVVTLKADTGFDAPWIVIHANDVAEAKKLVKEAVNEQLVNDTSTGARHFQKAWQDGQPQKATVPAQRQGGGRPGKPAAATQSPDGEEAPDCKHGTMKFVSKVGAKGPWKAWMCPAPKDAPDQCRPQWIN